MLGCHCTSESSSLVSDKRNPAASAATILGCGIAVRWLGLLERETREGVGRQKRNQDFRSPGDWRLTENAKETLWTMSTLRLDRMARPFFKLLIMAPTMRTCSAVQHVYSGLVLQVGRSPLDVASADKDSKQGAVRIRPLSSLAGQTMTAASFSSHSYRCPF